MSTVDVSTRLGPVRGVSRGTTHQFLGLRYAEPPGRYLPCRPVRPWTSTYDATAMREQCHQRPGINIPTGRRFADGLGPLPDAPMSEDCLFLNIYVPAAPVSTARPVLVWVHGGGFWEGSANGFDGSVLCVTADAVVVIVSYRVGYLGVADLRGLGGDYAGSVNLWHQDQIAALQWVHDNIGDYGGDPGNVTVLGQSAGGTSTIALAASPRTQGLMHRAVALSPAFIASNNDQHGALAAVLGIEASAVPEWLLAATPEELVAVAHAGALPSPFVDGEVIPRNPHEALRNNAVPLICGFTPHEGQYLNVAMGFDGLSPDTIGLFASFVAHLSADAVPDDYLDRLLTVTPTDDPLVFADLVWTDLIRCSSVLAAEATARSGAAAWHYLFDVPGNLLGHPMESTHCVDIPFTFGLFEIPERARYLWVTDDEANRELAQRWMQMIGTFARTGSPGGSLGHWPRYDESSRHSLHVTSGHCTVLTDLDATHREKVWTRSVPL